MGTQAGGEAGAQRRAGRGEAQEDSFLLGQEREFKPLLSAPRLPQRWKKKKKTPPFSFLPSLSSCFSCPAALRWHGSGGRAAAPQRSGQAPCRRAARHGRSLAVPGMTRGKG